MVLALVFIALVALAVLPIPIRINVGPWMEFRSWRLDILVCGLVLLLAFAGACGLPESPQFLMAMGREDEALAALQFAYAWNTGNVPKVKNLLIPLSYSSKFVIFYRHFRIPKSIPTKLDAAFVGSQYAKVLPRCGSKLGPSSLILCGGTRL